MASPCPKFRNDNTAAEIRIGARAFHCIGVTPPHDHPHVYINMGEQDAILCPIAGPRFRSIRDWVRSRLIPRTPAMAISRQDE